MSTTKATSAKPLKVTTSYKRNELKLVKVAIRRRNLKSDNNTQPLERIVKDPFTITSFVNVSSDRVGVKLFNKITPNTIEIPAEAYCKTKTTPTVRGTTPPPEQEPGPSRPRSASCSSDEGHQQEDRCRSKSREKFKANDAAQAVKQVPSTERNTHSPYENAERYDKRKSRRSGSRSPSLRRSRYSYSPSRRHSPGNGRHRSISNSPHHRSRSRSSERLKANDVSPSAKQKRRTPDRDRDRERSRSPVSSTGRYDRRKSGRSGSRSPSSKRNRYHSPSRRYSARNGRHHSSSISPHNRSRSRSSEKLKTNDPSQPGRQKRRTPDRERERSQSRTGRYDKRKSGRADSPEFYGREAVPPYFDPALIRAPISFYPAMPPYYPPGMPPAFFNQPFFPAQHPGPFGPGNYQPRKRLPLYMNRKIQVVTSSAGNTGTLTNSSMSEGDAAQSNIGVTSEITPGTEIA
ncbi:serine/arginine repetitive matrix protein 2-like [Atheta coriaria]|uniref:serine/arginine repetitive matrix protein 2-like n=1 Tax=Dalotia coriaria TaxID=877792 RepID=UPI0031F3BCCB